MTKFEIIVLAAPAKLGFFLNPAPFKMCIRTKGAGQRKPPSSYGKLTVGEFSVGRSFVKIDF